MTPILCLLFVFISFSHADFVIDEDQYEIVTDLKDTCGANEYYMLDHKGPLPQCVFIDKLNSCNLCPPGYKCGGTMCIMDETSCAVYHFKGTDRLNYYKNALWKPVCLDDGSWAPKQCKGEPANGRCFCYSAFGQRLHGHEWSWKAEKMTCACSRKRWELEQVMTDDDMIISLHCDDWGNYEPLQCNAGSCWCAENMSGKVLSKVVPELMMEYLPCYNATEVGTQYLRQCESNLYGHKKIVAEFKRHGTMYQNFPDIQCQADGSYGKYKISNGIVYCVWKDNKNMGSWNTQLNPKQLPLMNCNCAYDTKIYEAAGQMHTLACKPNGNYEPMQMIKLKNYCVDGDGFVKSGVIPDAWAANPNYDCDVLYK